MSADAAARWARVIELLLAAAHDDKHDADRDERDGEATDDPV